jgi:phage terminase large subunit-like protein
LKKKSQLGPPPAASAYPQAERVHAYARAVVSGAIVAGHWVRLSCRRHLDDLEHGHKRGLVFRPEKATAAIIYHEHVLHLREGVPFKLEDFQAFIVGSLFGWYAAESAAQLQEWQAEQAAMAANPKLAARVTIYRRFRHSYEEMAKGNGKTPLAAGRGLYGLDIDDEDRPEVYSTGVTADQAGICFKDAAAMVAASPALRSRLQVLTGSITNTARMGVFRPLSSEHRNLDGKRPHIGIVDELHEHPTSLVTDKISAGTKARRNSLIIEITNSGSGQHGVCWKHHHAATKVLTGALKNDALFAYIAALDPCPKCRRAGKHQPDEKCDHCDKWTDEKVWIKANPGLGTILPRSYVRQQVTAALTVPSQQNIVKRLNFCLWTEAASGWVDMYAWNNQCRDSSLKIEQFEGKPCWLAIDAANKIDVTAMAAVFELDPGAGRLDPAKLDPAVRAVLEEAAKAASRLADSAPDSPDPSGPPPSAPSPPLRQLAAAGYAVFFRFFVPKGMVDNQSQANHELYQQWRTEDRLIVTEGNRTDFVRIEEEVRSFSTRFNIRRLAFDPKEMTYLVQRIQAWADFELVEFRQSPQMISQPMKELEAFILSALIKHDGDPVATWMMGNVEQKEARGGGPLKYYFPVKPTEAQKIDGPVALIMALDCALRSPSDEAAAPFVISVG